MVKLNRKLDSTEYLTESKQVGDLYHVCTLDAFVSYIIPENQLKGSGKYLNTLVKSRDIVSFTRNKRFTVPTSTVYNNTVLFQFKVDGNSLSNRYKVLPYSDIRYTKGEPIRDEDEEIVVGTISNFKSYIKEVKFDIKSLDVLKNKTVRSFIIKLNKVKRYLGDIPCTRGDLPYSFLGKITYAKGKDSFKINTLDDLIQYMKSLESSNNDSLDSSYIDSEDLFKQYLYSKDSKDDVIDSVLKEHPTWDKYVLGKNLIDSCKSGDVKKIKDILKSDHVERFINMYDNKGHTPLSLLCNFYNKDKSKGVLNAIKQLLEKGASTVQLVGDQQDMFDSITSLLLNQSYQTDPEVFNLLLKRTPYIPSEDGGTILYNIVNSGLSEEEKIDRIKPIIKRSGKALTVNGSENALDLALYFGWLKVAKYLLDNGSDPNSIVDKSKSKCILENLITRFRLFNKDEGSIKELIEALLLLTKYDLKKSVSLMKEELLYDILFLFKEKEADSKKVKTILNRLLEQGLSDYINNGILKVAKSFGLDKPLSKYKSK